MTEATPEAPTPQPAVLAPGIAARSIDPATTARLEEALSAAAANLPGVSVAVVTAEGTWFAQRGLRDVLSGAPVTADTIFYIGSVSKPLTATGVLAFVDSGALSLDDHLATRAPGWSLGGSDEVTLAHVLTHTSGLPREGGLEYWFTGSFPTAEALRTELGAQRLVATPGADWLYSNAAYASLGAVVSATTEGTFGAAMTQRVFEPLGMAQSGVPTAAEGARLLSEGKLAHAYTGATGSTGREGRAFAGLARTITEGPFAGRRERIYHGADAMSPAFGMASTAPDLAAWVRMLLGVGPETLLTPASREAMLQAKFRFGADATTPGGWSIGLRVIDGQPPYLRHGGWFAAYRSHVSLQLDPPIGVVVLTNADDADPNEIGRVLREAASGAQHTGSAQTE